MTLFSLKSIKTQLIIYLACFALFLATKEKNISFLTTAFIAVASCVVIEGAVLFYKTKSFKINDSAIITGLIIGYVLAADGPWWTFLAAGALAILSKYLIRFAKKHIFNPAAFGIFLTTIIFGASTEWKGTYSWYVLVPLGLYFTYKIRKIEIIIGYAVISLILFGTQAFLQKIPLGNIFGYLSYFYIFIMVIEPKTTPVKTIGKYIFGAGLAALIFIVTEIGVKFDAELFSLLAMNVTVPLLNKLPLAKGGKA